MVRSKVVDAWAMLAWLQDEPAAAQVGAFLEEAAGGSLELSMSWFNAAEVFYVLAKRKSLAVAQEFLDRLPSLPIHMVLPDQAGIMAAARIKAAHRVAFGDAFGMALAQALGASVITELEPLPFEVLKNPGRHRDRGATLQIQLK
jgi:ribonuclease VapC